MTRRSGEAWAGGAPGLSRIDSAPRLLAKQRGQCSALSGGSSLLNETAKLHAGQLIFIIELPPSPVARLRELLNT
jgi:hypothetical protein